MRPAPLAPLFAPVEDLPGVGPKVGAHLRELCGPLALDLIWHWPLRFIDRRLRPGLSGLESGQIATLKLHIGRHEVPGRKGLPLKIPCMAADGGVTLIFFNARAAWIEKQFPAGSDLYVSGRLDLYQGLWQMVHPDWAVTSQAGAEFADFEPVYGTKAGLTQKPLAKAVNAAIDRVPALPDWTDTALQTQRKWPDFTAALTHLHAKQEGAEEAKALAVERLAYDELLAGQIALAVLRAHRSKASGPNLGVQGALPQGLRRALPFDLTHDQDQAIALLSAQVRGPEQAMTLVQGDVGSGKTLVALMLMLQAVEAGHQAVLMAPTEILARQHAQTLQGVLGNLPVRLVCLTGQDKGAARQEIEAGIASGDTQIIIGTHALFQEGVGFAKVGLVVIDEQHRFGVQQRLALTQKGRAPHLILMSATPIPRTLVMAAYGDLDICEIRQKPAGRKPIQTLVKPLEGIPQVLQSLERLLAQGGQAYWICPLVEESEGLPGIGDATSRFHALKKDFGDQVGLIHGQMKGTEKEAAMADFKSGKTRILVATTVIEVGVDVPNANFMVIEHAERFGLAQMHQIRGRVGRGERQGACLLLYGTPLSGVAKKRLEAMRASNDGFDLSEQDLKLRGGGEILGTRQSGLPSLKIADYGVHGELMAIARKDAQVLLDRDPTLESQRGQAIRHLLYLFQKDQVAPFLKIG